MIEPHRIETADQAPRDVIVWWTGGGYSGCHWEPNCGYFDRYGIWNPVISTGRRKRDDFEMFVKEQDLEDDSWYKIDEESMLDMQNSYREDFFYTLLKNLAENDRYETYFECKDCGESKCIEDFGEWDGYRGDGGIGVVYEGMICYDCRQMNVCPSCGDYDSDWREATKYRFGLCWSCWSDMDNKGILEDTEKHYDTLCLHTKLYQEQVPHRWLYAECEKLKMINVLMYEAKAKIMDHLYETCEIEDLPIPEPDLPTRYFNKWFVGTPYRGYIKETRRRYRRW